MSVLSTVIFDLDDTLFDHRGAATAGVRHWLAAMGVAPSDELIRLWFDAEERHVAAWHRGEASFAEQRRHRLQEILPMIGRPVPQTDAELNRMFADFLGRYAAAWRSFDDVRDALAAVAEAGLGVALLTNGAEHQQHQKLASIGLAGRVGPVFCCDALGFAKPDPRAYQRVCTALGVAGSEVLHVGDRHDLDVVAARAAGLHAVHLDRENRGPHDEAWRLVSLRTLGTFLEPALVSPAVDHDRDGKVYGPRRSRRRRRS